MHWISTIVIAVVIGSGALTSHAQVPAPQLQPPVPSLVVTGEGEVSVRPDRAVVRLGATAQANDAKTAQEQVNAIVNKALEAITGLGIRQENISTAGLSLYPVFSNPSFQPPREGEQQQEPRIVGYRASNTLQIRTDDIKQVGAVIDAGVGAGANQLESLTFELKDNANAYSEAIQQAARRARDKASTLANAMGVRLLEVLEVTEGGATVIPPIPYMGRAMLAEAGTTTPVEPGQIQVKASVTIRYKINAAQ